MDDLIEVSYTEANRLNELLVQAVIDETFRKELQKDFFKTTERFHLSPSSVAVAKKLDFKQLQRFHEVAIGTRLITMKQIIGAGSSQEVQSILADLIEEFLKVTVIRDGRSSLDIQLFAKFAERKYPGSILASLVRRDVARYRVSWDQKSSNASHMSISLAFRVALFWSVCDEDELNSIQADSVLEEHAGRFFYVILQDADKDILIHEVDQDSYNILKAIDQANEKNDAELLDKTLKEHPDLIAMGLEEGLLEQL